MGTLCGGSVHAAEEAARSLLCRVRHDCRSYQPDKGAQGSGAPYNAAAKFYTVYSGDTALEHDLRISHVAAGGFLIRLVRRDRNSARQQLS